MVFVLFYAMDLSRCVLITTEEHIWVNILPYLLKKREEYNWILNRLKDSEKLPNDKVEVFVWWSEKTMFSATPLRSYLKRLKQKAGVNQNKKRKECFQISKSIKTKSILKKLVQSTRTHYWDDSFVGKELSEYLEAGILRLTRYTITFLSQKTKAKGQGESVSESEATKQSGMEVVEQQSEPSALQQNEQQPSTSQQSEPQTSTLQVKVENDGKQKDSNPVLKLCQNQINGLILKLLSRVSVNVTNMGKDIAIVNGKTDRITESIAKNFVVLSGKMDKTSYSEPAGEKEYTKELKVTKGRNGLKWYTYDKKVMTYD